MKIEIKYGFAKSGHTVIISELNLPQFGSLREGKLIIGDPQVGDLIPRACENCRRNKDGSNLICDGIHELVVIFSVQTIAPKKRRGYKRTNWNRILSEGKITW